MREIHERTEVLRKGDLEEVDKAIIMIHGRGASAHGMLQLADQLPDIPVLAPQATNREWYPYSFLEPVERNQPHLDSALGKLDSLVDEAEEAVGKEKIVLLGFSQGACLVSEYAARNTSRYGAIAALSGGLIGEELRDYSGEMQGTDFFIGCAENDPHIPLTRVNETADVFENLGADVEKHVFEGSNHGVTQYEIDRIREIIEDL